MAAKPRTQVAPARSSSAQVMMLGSPLKSAPRTPTGELNRTAPTAGSMVGPVAGRTLQDAPPNAAAPAAADNWSSRRRE